jgi:hypothetical protein
MGKRETKLAIQIPFQVRFQNDTNDSSSFPNFTDFTRGPLHMYDLGYSTMISRETIYGDNSNIMNTVLPTSSIPTERISTIKYGIYDVFDYSSSTSIPLKNKIPCHEVESASCSCNIAPGLASSSATDHRLLCSPRESCEQFSPLTVVDSPDNDAKTFDLLLEFADRYYCHDHITNLV